MAAFNSPDWILDRRETQGSLNSWDLPAAYMKIFVSIKYSSIDST